MKRPNETLHGLMILAAGSLLAACNTVEGIGEDIESAGGAIEDSAQANKASWKGFL